MAEGLQLVGTVEQQDIDDLIGLGHRLYIRLRADVV
jgi:hypothetical protein